MFHVTRLLLGGSPPKKRFSLYLRKRRRLMWFLDKYRYLMKPRQEQYERRLQTEHIWMQPKQYTFQGLNSQSQTWPIDPKKRAFRYQGFWSGGFGYQKIPSVRNEIAEAE
eukprot:gnl/MRDRNA2_/MRDRNA2_140988_c0_seq1.p1 gnl/MRDRNA2_/MRDRNA2_140988_c0~~gnl/MRDRNA2_/MRDRNA2_140988_c0_seq1.p1  ORF type:complete len:110 (-),score=8.57 gnl/MRDRNA2_/MRDRNA2_140988_c0_seq1:31-360(-)